MNHNTKIRLSVVECHLDYNQINLLFESLIKLKIVSVNTVQKTFSTHYQINQFKTSERSERNESERSERRELGLLVVSFVFQ